MPGYRSVLNPIHRQEVEQLWGLPSGDDRVGKTPWEMITGLETEEVGLLWIAATNPVVSMPDLERTKKVTSPRAEGQFKVKVTRSITPKTVFVTMHWGFLWWDNALNLSPPLSHFQTTRIKSLCR